MLRVLETIQNSEFSSSLIVEQADLQEWVDEILTAAWTYQVSGADVLNPRYTVSGAVCLA